MKKFFSILLTAALALVSVPSCGGGGDKEASVRITADQFAACSKRIELTSSPGTLYIDFNSATAPYSFLNEEPQADGTVEKQVFGVKGEIKLGSNGTSVDALFIYTVIEDANKLPIEATLQLGLDDPVEEGDPLCDFLGIEGIAATPDDDNEDPEPDEDMNNGEGGEIKVFELVTIELKYESKTFNVTTANPMTTGVISVYPAR